MRRCRGFMADSARWEHFAFRSEDVISTPSTCGTTWIQMIIAVSRNVDERLRLLAGDVTDRVLRGEAALEEDRSPT